MTSVWDSVAAGRDLVRDAQQNAFMRQAGSALAGGDYQGAANTLARGGDVTGALQLQSQQGLMAARDQQVQTQKLAAAKQQLDYFREMATGLRRLPLEQRPQAAHQYAQRLHQFGVDTSQLGQIDPEELTDAGLDLFTGELDKADLQLVQGQNGQLDTYDKRTGKLTQLRAATPPTPKGAWHERKKADGSTEMVWLDDAPPSQGAAPQAFGAPQQAGADLPRGLRNNNPLNLRPLAQGQWNGQTGSDGGYATFASEQDGWNAAHKNLQAYGTRHGINTIARVINRWAPSSENDTPAYIRTVSQAMGVDPNAPIDLNQPQVREKLLSAMADVELGRAYDGPGQGSARPQLPPAQGMLAEGNLDPWNRPILNNPDGSYSTTSSISIGTDKGEVLIPTVVNGKRLTNEQAIAHFRQTSENLGTFDTPEHADRYAEALHNAQAANIERGGRPAPAAPAPGRRAIAWNEAGASDDGINLTADAVQQAAETYVATGQLPPLGSGKQAAELRQQIMNRAGDIRKAGGIDGYRQAEMAASYAANRSALTQVSRQRNMIESFEQTAIKNADLALNLAPRGGGTTSIPVLNRWIQKGRKSVAGDPDVAAFDAALGTFADEYAKIVSGNTGAAGATDSVRAEVHQRINGAMNPEQLRSVISTMKQEMRNRSESLKDQESQLRTALNGRPPTSAKPAGQQPAGQFTDAQRQYEHANPKSGARGSRTQPFFLRANDPDASYNGIPKNAYYVDPDGQLRKKAS